nr:M56 family metallopeptidase [uncultured Dyadobacter sp.]
MTGTYLLEANLCLIAFIALYRIAFQNTTFFIANRFYLLLGMLFSATVPALSFPLFNSDWQQARTLITGLENHTSHLLNVTNHAGGSQWSYVPTILWVIYAVVAGFHFFKLAADVCAIIRLIRKYPARKVGNAYIVWVDDEVQTSSFLHYIFLNRRQTTPAILRTCVAHELVHYRQWHTADWLLIRLLSALFWFNPLMGIWRRAVAMNHEYLADASAASQAGRFRYTHLLVDMAASTRISALHYFSYGQIKSRITMLHRTPSEAAHRLRFLAVVPLATLMLLIFSCENAMDQRAPLAQYLDKNLIGIWENMNRITMNDNDGKTPRDFPERSGNVKVCLSNLELRADGRFEMHDANRTSHLTGTWKSLRNEVRLYCDNENAQPSLIELQIEQSETGAIGAWQHYAADEVLSAGHVFYEYRKL